MDEIRAYLEEKAETPREWLRRDPRTTHPTIIASVVVAHDCGLFYDADVLVSVARDLSVPESLQGQLGHEIYVAKGCLRDAEASTVEDALVADGYKRLDDVQLVDGARYLYRHGTVYVGRDVSDYADAVEVRAKMRGDGHFMLLPKGARTRGYLPSSTSLLKAL